MLRSAHLLIALSILLGLWLVIAKGLKDMLLIGASALWLGWIGLELERRRKSHTIIGEFAGIAAMSLIAPAAEYCASSLLSGRTFGIYLMCTAFFGGSVFHVRFVVRQHARRAKSLITRVQAGWPSALYHLGAVLLIAAPPQFMPGLSNLMFLALIPVTVKTFTSIATPARGNVSILRIGLLELAHTVIFVVLVLGIDATKVLHNAASK